MIVKERADRSGREVSWRIDDKETPGNQRKQAEDYVLNEHGLLPYFQQLQKFFDAWPIGFVRKRGGQLIKILKFSVAELIQQQTQYFQELETEKDFAIYACAKAGHDPTFLREMYMNDKAAINSFKQSKAKHPKIFEKVFSGFSLNDWPQKFNDVFKSTAA